MKKKILDSGIYCTKCDLYFKDDDMECGRCMGSTWFHASKAILLNDKVFASKEDE